MENLKNKRTKGCFGNPATPNPHHNHQKKTKKKEHLRPIHVDGSSKRESECLMENQRGGEAGE